MIKHASLGSIVAVLGCSIGAPDAKAEPLLFIVSYHNVDYAKTACDYLSSMQKSGFGRLDEESIAGVTECKSVRDTRDFGRQLENSLIDALAVEPLCGGVTVIRDPHPEYDGGGFSKENFAIKQSKPHWDLHLDYRPGTKAFGWTLFFNKPGMKPDGAIVNGEGIASKAASQICTVASGRGATIR